MDLKLCMDVQLVCAWLASIVERAAANPPQECLRPPHASRGVPPAPVRRPPGSLAGAWHLLPTPPMHHSRSNN
eukprot:3320112-Pyramimonas_sp.AAC.1